MTDIEVRNKELAKLSNVAYTLDEKRKLLTYQLNEIKSPGIYGPEGSRMFHFFNVEDALATIEELSRKIKCLEIDIVETPFLMRYAKAFERVDAIAQMHKIEYQNPVKK